MKKLFVSTIAILVCLLSFNLFAQEQDVDTIAPATDEDVATDEEPVATDEEPVTDGDPAVTDEEPVVTDDEPVAGECTGISIEGIEYDSYYGMLSSTEVTGLELAEGESAQFQMEFYADEWPVVGTYDLGSATNANYATCDECVRLYHIAADGQNLVRQYFQESGSLEVTSIDNAGASNGVVSAKLVEVTIASGTYESTPVENGACVEFEAVAWETVCVPNCDGKICGSDGCGGTCGEGCGDLMCNEAQDACVDWDCTKITLNAEPKFDGSYVDDSVYLYEFAHTPAVAEGDYTTFQLYDAIEAGEYDLKDTNYADCDVCLLLYEEVEYDEDGYLSAIGKRFFQQSGKVNVSSFNGNTGAINATFSNVRLVEVTIDSNYTSVEVPGGKCYEIDDAPFAYGGNDTGDTGTDTGSEPTDTGDDEPEVPGDGGDSGDTVSDEEPTDGNDDDAKPEKSKKSSGCALVTL